MNRVGRRAGIATLEFVLVFPMLLAMAAAMFMMGRAILRKESVASVSRNDSWQKRQSANPGTPLKIGHDPMTSEVEKIATHRVSLSPIFRGTQLTAESQSHVLGRPWNFDDLRFLANRGLLRVHKAELDKITNNIPGVATVVNIALNVLRLGMHPGINPVMLAGVIVGIPGNAIVYVSGTILKFVTSPIVSIARAVVKVLERIARWTFQRSLARRLARIANMMSIALDAFDNLYEASRGRPGSWTPGMAQQLGRSLP